MRIIAGRNKGKKLKSVKGSGVRPTSDRAKEALFNILGPDVMNVKFLDLYAGFGGIGIEAISRGAKEAVFIEQNRQNAKAIKENLSSVDYQDESKVIKDDVLKALIRLRGNFELIFMDPPYQEKKLYLETLKQIKEYNLLHPTGILIIEHHVKADIDWPPGYEVIKERNYGNTALTLLRGESKNG